MLTKRLKSLRIEFNLTQKQLAQEINTTQQNIGFWESGKRKPKYESIEKLAKFFNVSTDYLLGNTDHKTIDEDIEDAIQPSVAYNGNPISEDDKKAISDFLKSYFESKDS